MDSRFKASSLAIHASPAWLFATGCNYFCQEGGAGEDNVAKPVLFMVAMNGTALS